MLKGLRVHMDLSPPPGRCGLQCLLSSISTRASPMLLPHQIQGKVGCRDTGSHLSQQHYGPFTVLEHQLAAEQQLVEGCYGPPIQGMDKAGPHLGHEGKERGQCTHQRVDGGQEQLLRGEGP